MDMENVKLTKIKVRNLKCKIIYYANIFSKQSFGWNSANAKYDSWSLLLSYQTFAQIHKDFCGHLLSTCSTVGKADKYWFIFLARKIDDLHILLKECEQNSVYIVSGILIWKAAGFLYYHWSPNNWVKRQVPIFLSIKWKVSFQTYIFLINC